jgi:hypothetical protein
MVLSVEPVVAMVPVTVSLPTVPVMVSIPVVSKPVRGLENPIVFN